MTDKKVFMNKAFIKNSKIEIAKAVSKMVNKDTVKGSFAEYSPEALKKSQKKRRNFKERTKRRKARKQRKK